MRWKEQRNERASACAKVVLPTPGTSSISRWPRASRQTIDRRTTSGLPRIEVLSDTSNSFSLDSASGAATITVIVLCWRSKQPFWRFLAAGQQSASQWRAKRLNQECTQPLPACGKPKTAGLENGLLTVV